MPDTVVEIQPRYLLYSEQEGVGKSCWQKQRQCACDPCGGKEVCHQECESVCRDDGHDAWSDLGEHAFPVLAPVCDALSVETGKGE